MEIPPAPVLSPEEALGSFRVAPGYRIELVASEPLIHDPVALAFAPDGALWVVEMRGFMPNVDGEGEREPTGRIVVLRDDDGDGRMDRSTVFADQLVLPRAVLPVGDGALVLAPPVLWYCTDTDGDGRADRRLSVAEGFTEGLDNPEYGANAPLWALDNWIYFAHHDRRYRCEQGAWRSEPTRAVGQWGLSQDDWGRHYYNYNSDPLRLELYSPHYTIRHPELGTPKGVSHQPMAERGVFAARVTPGVNRGYVDGMLADGRLAVFTAACGPSVYRGQLFRRGNAFVCEPAAHLVREVELVEDGGLLVGRNAHGGAEVLVSTDERFRPVNTYSGPDGAVYVVDFYRGILQHRNYLTTFLRKQIVARGLDRPVGLGRIYRLVPEGRDRIPPPPLHEMSPKDLAAALGHANGWVRDNARRLLVERGDGSNGALAAILGVLHHEPPGPAVQALWTLEGLGLLDESHLRAQLSHPSSRVRCQVIRLIETLPEVGAGLVGVLQRLVLDPDPWVRRQLALTLTAGDVYRHAWARQLLVEVVGAGCEDEVLRHAAASGLHRREAEHLGLLLQTPAWQEETEGKSNYVSLLARCVARRRSAVEVVQLLESASEGSAWFASAVVGGVRSAARPEEVQGFFAVEREPSVLRTLEVRPDARVRDLVGDLRSMFTSPATEGVASPGLVVARERVDRGAELYAVQCIACHRPDGEGHEALGPPLRGSQWVHGSAERLAQIVLRGLRGPVEVRGETWDMLMPGQPQLSDDDLADVLTYVRTAWQGRSSAVDAALVGSERARSADRVQPWTVEELHKEYPQ